VADGEVAIQGSGCRAQPGVGGGELREAEEDCEGVFV